jgi:hypothetical protein
MSQIKISQFFEDRRQKLGLTWVAGRDGGEKYLADEDLAQSTQGVIGHLNFIHPNWIQVLGDTEVNYLNGLAPSSLDQHMQRLAQSRLYAAPCSEPAVVLYNHRWGFHASFDKGVGGFDRHPSFLLAPFQSGSNLAAAPVSGARSCSFHQPAWRPIGRAGIGGDDYWR